MKSSAWLRDSAATALRGDMSGFNYKEFVFPGTVAMIVLFTAIMWGVSPLSGTGSSVS